MRPWPLHLGQGMLNFMRPPAEDAGKDVLEPAPVSRICRRTRPRMLTRPMLRPPLETGEVKAAEVYRTAVSLSRASIGLGRSRVDLVGVEAQLVVDLALLLIAQHVVGLGDFLELLLGPLVVGVHVWVIAPRSLAEGLPDLLRRRRLLHAERAVIILVLGRGHSLFRLVSLLRATTSLPSSGCPRSRF